ncbi:uncharacterized protein J3D65DRAFT_178361 [Phyllosticta citribraziliensis]|uniref:Uncharacterized protein n=1 Tax=Phyllosticta citribraziliensis TaxID=989973 RepID=A0ABR1L212_9PEZI
MHLNLAGKVVLVTGGTKGIGRAIVQTFLSEGAHVHLCSRTQQDVTDTVEKLQSQATQSGGFVMGAAVDVSNEKQIVDWVKSSVEASGKIDVVVSNVSALSMGNDTAAWSTAFQVDILGTVALVNAALPYLEKSKGSIVGISSVSGRDVDFTAPSPYGALKASLTHYMAQLARTHASKGIRANTVSPGNIYAADGVWGSIERGNPELFNSQLAKNPTGRMGSVEEVANAVVFLSSSKASFISGTNLLVDGALCTGVQQ